MDQRIIYYNTELKKVYQMDYQWAKWEYEDSEGECEKGHLSWMWKLWMGQSKGVFKLKDTCHEYYLLDIEEFLKNNENHPYYKTFREDLRFVYQQLRKEKLQRIRNEKN